MPDRRRRDVLLVGPTPPPYNGMTTATRTLLDSGMSGRVSICHLDTADRRSLDNVGRYDFHNIVGALGVGARALRMMLAERPYVVYVPVAQNTPGYLRDSLILVPARLLGRSIIVHLRGSQFREFYAQANGPTKALVRFTLARAKRAVVLGENLRVNFEEFVPAERIVVVPNGLDLFSFEESASGSKGGDESPRVLYLSSIRPEKGFFDLLEAVPAIAERHPAVRFVLAGEPRSAEIADRATRRIDELGVANVVVMPGLVTGSDKVRTLEEADVFVLPSHAEGQPWTILEAMAASLPVVATDVGCVRDMVVDGVNGFIVPQNEPDAIARAVTALLDDPGLRRSMGAAGRRLLEERFTSEHFVEGMTRVFEDVLAETGARR